MSSPFFSIKLFIAWHFKAPGPMALWLWPDVPMAPYSCFKNFGKLTKYYIFRSFLHIKLQLSIKLHCVGSVLLWHWHEHDVSSPILFLCVLTGKPHKGRPQGKEKYGNKVSFQNTWYCALNFQTFVVINQFDVSEKGKKQKSNMHAAMPAVIKLDPPQKVIPRKRQLAQMSGRYVPQQNQRVDP